MVSSSNNAFDNAFVKFDRVQKSYDETLVVKDLNWNCLKENFLQCWDLPVLAKPPVL